MLPMMEKALQSQPALHALIYSKSMQNVLGFSYFTGGFLGFYQLCQMDFKNRQVKPLNLSLPLWQIKAIWIIDLLGNLSFMLGGLASRPALSIGQWTFKKLSSLSLQKALQRQTHVIGKIITFMTVMAFIFGIPASIKFCYSSYYWLKDRLKQPSSEAPSGLPIRKMDALAAAYTVARASHFMINHPPSIQLG